MADARSFRIAPLLLEAFFVVLGVFLALAANEWREDRNDREQAMLAAASIAEELQANREALREATVFNAAMVDTLKSYLPPEAPPLPPTFFARGFFRPASVLSTAWDAAQSTGVLSHMEYDEVLRYAKLYAMQRVYSQQAVQIGDLIYEQMMEKGYMGLTANYRNFFSVLIGLQFFERRLAAEYDRVLPTADSTSTAPS